MKTCAAWMATGLIALTLAQPAMAGDFYAGPFLMGGFTDSKDPTRIPAQPTALRDGNDPWGPSAGGGAWFGYNMKKDIDLPLSLEFASSYRDRHDQDIGFMDVTSNRLFSIKSNVTTVDTMLSLIYDIPVQFWGMRPYVGGGAGVVYANMEHKPFFVTVPGASAPDSDSWNFAWQAQTGVKYALSDSLDLRLDYRYIDMGTVSTGLLPTVTGDEFETDLSSHDFRLGLAWAF